MLQPRRRRKPVGITLIEILTVTSIMSGLHSQSNFQYAINKANEVKGLSNLRQIHLLLQTQCIAGALPRAAFFPEGDPKKDPKSITRLIAGAPPQLFVSPFAPPSLQDKGLSYAWNTALNGRTLDTVPRTTWVLIDVTAFLVDPDIPKPGKYLVLYADGRAEAIAEPPADIVKSVREAQAKKAPVAPKKGASLPKPLPPRDPKGPAPNIPKIRLPGGQTVPMPPSVPGL
ncbi:MAG TPA: type II secretion system protein [Planctomycetota bacterium]|nr:type II secretion system protein [Planctomycetota bacterium]